jgi:hypothetical protein
MEYFEAVSELSNVDVITKLGGIESGVNLDTLKAALRQTLQDCLKLLDG